VKAPIQTLLFVPAAVPLAPHDVSSQIPDPNGNNQMQEQTVLMTPDCCSWWEVPQPLIAVTGSLLGIAWHRQKLTPQMHSGLQIPWL